MGYHVIVHAVGDPKSRLPETSTAPDSITTSGYRYYSPHVGRFLNRDPIGDDAFSPSATESRISKQHARLQQQTREPEYCFLVNDPVDRVDLYGLVAINVKDNCNNDKMWADQIRIAYDNLMAILKKLEGIMYGVPPEFADVVDCLKNQDGTVNVGCPCVRCWLGNSSGIVHTPVSISLCSEAFDPSNEFGLPAIVGVEVGKAQCSAGIGRKEYDFARWINSLFGYGTYP